MRLQYFLEYTHYMNLSNNVWILLILFHHLCSSENILYSLEVLILLSDIYPLSSLFAIKASYY